MATANATNDPMTLDRYDGSATLDLYRAALGPIQADYYLKAFTRFDAVGKPGPGWNWAAAMLSLNWMVYYKLWIAALAYVGAVAGAALLLPGIGGLVFQLSAPTQWALLALTLLLSVAVPGLYGNAWLYRASNKRMEQALVASATLQEACATLTRQSGGVRRLISLAGLNVALCAFLAALALSWPDATALPPHTGPAMQAGLAGPVQSGLINQAADPAPAASAAPAPAPAPMPVTAAGSSAPAAAGARLAAPDAAPDAAPASQGTGQRSSQGLVQAAAAAATALERPAPLAVAPSPPEPVSAPSPARSVKEPSATRTVEKSARSAKALKATKQAKADKAEKWAKARTAKAGAPSGADKAVVSAAPSGAETYLINVGLFADANNARNALTKLQDANLPALSQQIKSSKGARTRVRVGPFDSQAEADRTAEKIRSLQLDAVVFKP